MTITDIIKAAIVAAGGDSLVNADLVCGCELDDLIPCDGLQADCVIALSRVLGPGEAYETASELLGPGDVLYEPLESNA